MRPLRLRMTITMMVMMMMMMWAFTSLAAAQCDPQTQYARGGECCKMCGPGTSMSSLGTCLEPQCQECRENEYQDKYTRESKCQLQPYCDRNTNFQAADHDTKKRTTCICKVGFHCSGEECMICVPHSTCGPGHGVHSKGNHTHDTVCQNCPDGTYSDEDSLDGVCKKWTECEKGQHIQHIGTDVSDAICETSRTHLTVILAVLFAVFVVFTAGFMFWRCKDKQDNAKGKVKGCVESCLGETHEPLKEATGLITTPTEPVDEEYCTSGSMPESSQDEGFQRTPEENEDEPSQEMSHDVLLTENGKIVTQENGKAEVLSRQESQTQTITG